MQPMIGLRSGLDRVRWNASAISPQPAMTPRMRAPRARADSRLSSTIAPAPSAITTPSRFLEIGLAAPSGGSFVVDYEDSSDRRLRPSGVTDPSSPTHRPAP